METTPEKQHDLAEPEVKREPMSYDEAEAGFYSTFLGCTVFDHFMAGVLFAEKHHGIVCVVENRLEEKNKRKEIDTPEQKFDPEPVKEILHTLLGTER